MNTVALKKAAATALLLLALPAAQADDWSGRVAGTVGIKQLDDSDWTSMDDQAEVGVMFDITRADWPVSIAVDLMISGADAGSSDPEIDFGYTTELHLGLRKIWSSGNFNRYVGGGLALAHGGFEQVESAGGAREDDSAVGGWVSAGAYWNLTEKFSLGFDVRYSQAEITVFDREIDAGGIHNTFTIGYSF